MEKWEYVVKKEFGKLIDVNAWVDDFVYYISLCTEPEFIDTVDMQKHYYNKALQCLDNWVKYNTYLPKETVHRIADTLKYLAEMAITYSSDDEESDIELAEVIGAIYDLVEMAKIVSVINIWERVREKYGGFSIEHTTA